MSERSGDVATGPVLFFDERCSVCRRFISFAIGHDTSGALRIAPLRSARGEELRQRYPAFERNDSAVWVGEDGKAVGYSDAILSTLDFLGGRWRVLAALARTIPRTLRNWAYREFATHRPVFGRFGLPALDDASVQRLLPDDTDATGGRVLDRESLMTYLNDHLAASIAALQLLERLVTTLREPSMVTTLRTLTDDVTAEQGLVRDIIAAGGGTENTMAQAVSWVGEKVARLKIGPGESDPSGLMLFEALEAISVGFWGRRCLWSTLAHLSREVTVPPGTIDFAALEARAEQHLTMLDALRLQSSSAALSLSPPALMAH